MIVQTNQKTGLFANDDSQTPGSSLRLRKNSDSQGSPVKTMNEEKCFEPLRTYLPKGEHQITLNDNSPQDNGLNNRLETCLPKRDFNVDQFKEDTSAHFQQMEQA